jgi:hypothetical protein
MTTEERGSARLTMEIDKGWLGCRGRTWRADGGGKDKNGRDGDGCVQGRIYMHLLGSADLEIHLKLFNLPVNYSFK